LSDLTAKNVSPNCAIISWKKYRKNYQNAKPVVLNVPDSVYSAIKYKLMIWLIIGDVTRETGGAHYYIINDNLII
jgi:hypothetical protein